MKSKQAKEFLAKLEKEVDQLVATGIEGMPGEECQAFCADFVRVMAGWQPHAIGPEDDTIQVAITSLYLAKVFPLAFEKAYEHTEGMLDAKEAIRKAFQ